MVYTFAIVDDLNMVDTAKLDKSCRWLRKSTGNTELQRIPPELPNLPVIESLSHKVQTQKSSLLSVQLARVLQAATYVGKRTSATSVHIYAVAAATNKSIPAA
jgi:hypothetical protein